MIENRFLLPLLYRKDAYHQKSKNEAKPKMLEETSSMETKNKEKPKSFLKKFFGRC